VGGLIVGGIVAATTIPDQHREPLYDHISARTARPIAMRKSCGRRELRDGPYESYPVPERYGVPPGHHYTIIQRSPVVYHRESRRVIITTERGASKTKTGVRPRF